MLATIRKVALVARHSDRLRLFEPVWQGLKQSYVRLLSVLAAGRGIEVTIAGYPIRLHPTFTTQIWEEIEPESYTAFAKELAPGASVVDIGAHIGTYSALALKIIGPHGTLLAYEPNDVARAHLIQHIAWADPYQIAIIRQVCCGKENGLADFYHLPGEVEGMSGLVPVDGFVKCVLPVVKLDDEVRTLGVQPDVLKIDVEGAEWDVLKGAEETLRLLKPSLFLSLHPKALAKRNESPREILEWLRSLGYDHQVVAEDHEIHVLSR